MKILRTENGKQNSGCNKARKSDLHSLNRGPQGSHLRGGNSIPSGSIYQNHQGPGELSWAEVIQPSGHPERHKDVLMPIPTSITEIDWKVAKFLLGKDIDAYVKLSHHYRENKAKI